MCDRERNIMSANTTQPAPTAPTLGGVAAAFREAMSRVCTPAAIVTSMDKGVPHGTTVSAFVSLSMNPSMVSVSLGRDSELLAMVKRVGRFGLNVLNQTQAGLALRFASKQGQRKFDGVDWVVDTDAPRICADATYLGCTVRDLFDGGDHVIITGNVVSVRVGKEPPLTYYRRSFGTHTALIEVS